MTKLPTKEENPDGLHQRYNITKADGSPVDPDAVYFVLRIDKNGTDPSHIEACREAAYTYYAHVRASLPPEHRLQKLATDLEKILRET